jgi:uncharacterized protein YxjI
MRYLMKQKWLALGDDFTIEDEQGNRGFYVDGRVFSLGDKLSFQDMQGNELAFISQKLLAWGKTYYIYRRGELAAVVKKSIFTLFRCEFTVDVPGPNDLVADGDFLDHEYSFSRHADLVATVSKKWFRLTDTYGISIVPGADDVLILAAAVVIDLCCHHDRD